MVFVAAKLREGARALLQHSPLGVKAPTFSVAFSLPIFFALPVLERQGARMALRPQPALATLQLSVCRRGGRAPASRGSLPGLRPDSPGARRPSVRLRQLTAARVTALMRRALPLRHRPVETPRLLAISPRSSQRATPAPFILAQRRRLPAGRQRLLEPGMTPACAVRCLPDDAATANTRRLPRPALQSRLAHAVRRCKILLENWLRA